ncbi:MAG: sigma-70 family RNA polymerase sigma factor [Bacteroidota bacterium]
MNIPLLVHKCQQGDPHYQRELVVRYSPMLLTVCRRYSRDEAAAKDILQESLIKILRGIVNYQPIGSFEAWMRRIAINTALQSFDKKCFQNEVYTIEQIPERTIVPDVYSRLEAEELMQLIAQLPQGYQQVFNLFAIEGYSHKEIGELLGIEESTSRSQLLRARKLLQNRLLTREKIRV